MSMPTTKFLKRALLATGLVLAAGSMIPVTANPSDPPQGSPGGGTMSFGFSRIADLTGGPCPVGPGDCGSKDF